MEKAIVSRAVGFILHLYEFALVLLIGCSLLAVTSISCSPPAQHRRRTPEAREAKPADQIITSMKANLALTEEEEIRVRPIIEDQVKKRNEFIVKYQGRGRQGMDSLRDDLKDLRISTASQLQYFLTSDQMIQYGELQREEDQRIAGEGGGKAPEESSQEKPKGKGRRSGRF